MTISTTCTGAADSSARQTTIHINTDALKHNVTQVRARTNAKILAMVKANAYGHGVAHCLPALLDVDGLGVASFSEARDIRLLGWDKPLVLIEGVFSEAEWQQALSFELSCVIHHEPQLQWAIDHVPDFADYPEHPSRTIWLKLNSGMNRLGFEPQSILPVAAKLHAAGYQLILTSHFANADEPEHPLNQQQIDVFDEVLQQLRAQVSPSIAASLCNSAGIINFPQSHHEWVRPGIMLYGSSPITPLPASQLNLRPVMTLSAALMASHELPAGTSVGYGSRYTAPTIIKKGIVSIGYGDGYPRVLSDQAWVSVFQDNTHYRCPIIGRVAMDMIAIDISQIPHPKLGSPVILWGDHLHHLSPTNDRLSPTTASIPSQNTAHDIVASNLATPSVDDVAEWAGTLGYELLCRLTTRPSRQLR